MPTDQVLTPIMDNPVPDKLCGGNAQPDAINNEASDSSALGASQQQARAAAVHIDGGMSAPASQPSTPVEDVALSCTQSCSPVHHERLTQVLAGYALLTPEQQKEVSRIINPPAVVARMLK